MKLLILIRGVPGSGKTTLANTLKFSYDHWNGVFGTPTKICHFEADQHMVNLEGNYAFEKNKLSLAHSLCHDYTLEAMQNGVKTIIVSNTFTQQWELEPYRMLATQYGYQIQEIICKADFQNVHDCPKSKVEMMKARFEYE